MVLTKYAQIDAAGRCVGELETSGKVNAPHMIEVDGTQAPYLGKRWTGEAWEVIVPTVAELAALELVQIDAATGMSRTMREAFIALAGKVGADVTYLAAQEAKAATARGKLGK